MALEEASLRVNVQLYELSMHVVCQSQLVLHHRCDLLGYQLVQENRQSHLVWDEFQGFTVPLVHNIFVSFPKA
jgi:hypothetical protein